MTVVCEEVEKAGACQDLGDEKGTERENKSRDPTANSFYNIFQAPSPPPPKPKPPTTAVTSLLNLSTSTLNPTSDDSQNNSPPEICVPHDLRKTLYCVDCKKYLCDKCYVVG